jgi:hypothetical protein
MGREVAGFVCSQDDRKDFPKLTFGMLVGHYLVYVSGYRRCLFDFSTFKQVSYIV